MWGLFDYSSRKRWKSRTRGDKKRKAEEGGRKRRYHLSRVPVEVRVDPDEFDLEGEVQVIRGRAVLSDLAPGEFALFLEGFVPNLTEVSITLNQPVQFYARGRVASCRRYSHETLVLSDSYYVYRTRIALVFESDDERKQVREYVKTLRREHIIRK